MHEVLRVLAARSQAWGQPGRRDDGFRVALAIEGGGMRGTVSAGMAFALDELGLVTAFDAVYGASAGAITAAWLLSRPEGLRPCLPPRQASPRRGPQQKHPQQQHPQQQHPQQQHPQQQHPQQQHPQQAPRPRSSPSGRRPAHLR